MQSEDEMHVNFDQSLEKTAEKEELIPTIESMKPKHVPNIEITLKATAVNEIPEFLMPDSDIDDSQESSRQPELSKYKVLTFYLQNVSKIKTRVSHLFKDRFA